jgi:hypothetical protein
LVGNQYCEFVSIRIVGASLEIVYKLVFFAIIVYISRGINRSNKAKRSKASTLEGMLAFGSRRSPGLKGLN